jgi:hypothetical protein
MYTKYFSQLTSSLQPIEGMISTLQHTISSLENKEGDVLVDSDYLKNSEAFKKYVHDYFQETSEFDTWAFFDQFEEIKEYISSFEILLEEEQDRDRFYALSSDGIVLKGGKLGKRIFWKGNGFLLRIRNQFRVLFKKEAISKGFWKHKIPQQQLAEWVYLIHFLENTSPIIKDLLVFRHEIYQSLKEIDSEIENRVLVANKWIAGDSNEKLAELAQGLGAKKNELELNAKELKAKLDLMYADLQAKVGTLEFPIRKIRTEKLSKKLAQVCKDQKKCFDNYNRRAFALFEHWRLTYEIRFSNLKLSEIFKSKRTELNSILEEVLLTADSSFLSILESALTKIESKNGLEEVQNNLLSRQLLQEKIPAYIEQLMERDFAPHFDLLVRSCTQEFENIKVTYLLPSKKSWDKDVKLPKLRDTNVREVVNGCLSESVEASVLRQKEDFVTGIHQSLSNANELSGIVEYAIEYYKEKDVEHTDNQHAEFVDGMERAVQKAKENKQFNLELTRTAEKQFETIKSDFIAQITGAITPDMLNQKQSEMIRKKRIRDAKNRLLRGESFFKDRMNKSYVGILALIKGIRSRYTAYREVLGLSEKSESIGNELSNYLSETEIAIGRLPLMYQRLFQIAPLSHAKFRIDRPEVIQQLEIAYSNWTRKKFAPTCMVGEMGSGMTSMLTVFEERFGHQYSVTRISLVQKIDGDEAFLEFLKTLFPDLKFETREDLLLQINEMKGRRIVIVENLHHLFLRKMHGSDHLMQFFQLISQSNSHVFWLCTCSLYANKYLHYTMKMNAYFAYRVSLDSLNKDQLSEVIIKRHKFSGFKLNFLAPKDFHPKRSYKRMSESEKQAYLEADYFNRLYKFAQSNLSLALLFWMRSIVRVEENNFYLQYKHLEYNFLNSLSRPQITTLHALILHGSLLVEEHAAVFGWEKEESFTHLMVFVDDGILIQKEGRYSINPLVYRLLVNHLSLLNYIH